MDKVYIGYRQGIYMQGIVAVSDTPEGALSYTKEVMRRENDSYHSFCVSEFPFGCAVKVGGEVELFELYWNRGFDRLSIKGASPPLIITREIENHA